MSLSSQQLKHEGINLVRLVKRLETIISVVGWAEEDKERGGDVWVKVESMTQKIRYARQLLLNVESYEGLDTKSLSRTVLQRRNMQVIRETLDKLNNVVDIAKQRLVSEPVAQVSYLSLVPLSTEEAATPEHVVEPSPETELIPSDSALEPHPPLVEAPTLDHLFLPRTLRNSELGQAPPIVHSPPTSSLLSSSLQAHEELSNELARMAAQLKRNAQHLSDSLDQDKSLVQAASAVLEQNYDTMTKERVRLRDHRDKSFGTTWMVFGALFTVSIAWVLMFLVVRLT